MKLLLSVLLLATTSQAQWLQGVSVLNGGTAKWQGIISSFQLEVKP
jgi:hypothetical protein